MTKPLSSLLLLMACAGLLGAETNSLVPFQSLGEGQKPYAGEIRPGLITSQTAWAALWAQYTGQTNYPSVDFTRDMVLPLTALMPAQGYRIGVERITTNASQLCAVITQEGEGQTNQAPTWAYHFVVLRQCSLPLTIEYLPRLLASLEGSPATQWVLHWQGFDTVPWEGRFLGCSNIYLLESSDSLTDPLWTPVEGCIWQSEPRTLKIASTNLPSRFYRVRSRPLNGSEWIMPVMGPGQQLGRISLPAGVTTDPASLQVANSLGQAAVQADGRFELKTIRGGPLLTVVLSPSGRPMLMGWLDEARVLLDENTTAQVLVYFASGVYLEDEAIQTAAMEWLAGAPQIDALAHAIASSLAADPDSLAVTNTVVSTALAQAVQAFRSARGSTIGKLGLTINPADSRSGLRLDIVNGINTLRFANRYRRRSHVFVDLTSYVQKADGRTVSLSTPIRKADLEIPPTTGLSGALSSFIDIANGAYAYSEVAGDPFELPLYGDSSQTTYRIAAVGLGKMLGVGLQPGDQNQLTAEEISEAARVRLRAAVFDVILPLVTSVVLPRLTYGGWKSIFQQPSNLELFADYINLVNQMPGLKEAIDSGSLGEIVNVAWGYINPATGSKAFQSATVSAVRKIVGLLANRGWATIEDVEGADKALGVAGEVFNALVLVNMGMGSVDFLVTASHIDRSNWCDIWSVTVTEPRVTLVPETSVIAPGDLLSLEAHVPEAEGGSSADQPVFTYRYTCSGQVGVINDHVHAGTSFESSSRYLLYEANEDRPGTDTITVEVFEVELDERTLVGKATATVEVLGTGININPAQPTVQAGTATNLLASIHPPPTPGTTLEYRWTCTSLQGTLAANESNAVYNAKADGNGDDTISLEVYEVNATNKTLLGKTNALITVRPYTVNLAPSEPAIWGSQSITLSAYLVPSAPVAWTNLLVYEWSCTGGQGTLYGDQGKSNVFSSTKSTATYVAKEAPTGMETVTVNVYVRQGTEKTLLGTDVSQITFSPAPVSYGRVKVGVGLRSGVQAASQSDASSWDGWLYVEFDRVAGYEQYPYRITGHGYGASVGWMPDPAHGWVTPKGNLYGGAWTDGGMSSDTFRTSTGGSRWDFTFANDWVFLDAELGTPSTILVPLDHVTRGWVPGHTHFDDSRYTNVLNTLTMELGTFGSGIWEAVPY